METQASKGNVILNSILKWRNGEVSSVKSTPLEPPADGSQSALNASVLLESESELLCKEHLRFKWNRVPSVEL